MGLWTAVVIIVGISVACATISEIYRERIRRGSLSSKQEAHMDEISDRMARLEERMANLETIVLEHEKRSKYDVLTH